MATSPVLLPASGTLTIDETSHPILFPDPEPPVSLLHGPVDPPLLDLTLNEVLDLQCKHFGTREFLVIPWTGARWTFSDLNQQSSLLARALLDMGIEAGDRVGIMAGNCEQYVAVFFAVVRIGAILVILNNTYTKEEAKYGLEFTECKIFFTTQRIGRLNNTPLLADLSSQPDNPKVVILRGSSPPKPNNLTYPDLLVRGSGSKSCLAIAEARVLSHNVCNLQFTSGTTGHPKAAMLTHHNLVNNSRFIGHRMRLTPTDILCCPPPLFHCFGLVLGLLATLTHGAKIVFPSETFSPEETLSAISDEACTAIHGVPTMFDAMFSLQNSLQVDHSKSTQPLPPQRPWTSHLRTGIIAGAPLPIPLLGSLLKHFKMDQFTPSYGLTEASPTVFNAHPDDPIPLRLSTVGTLMPHASAKLIDPSTGSTVPLGQRGELCISGYQLHSGYWNNSAKTAEVMRPDRDGRLWLHTGDEAVFDEAGYCKITGRYKDIVIKGGENVYPAEIEERLVGHTEVGRAVVVGVRDEKYGEVVAVFLEREGGHGIDGQSHDVNRNRVEMSDEEVREWVREKLGRHKAPTYVFWLGEGGVPGEVPLTGSGKVKKFEMAKLAEELVSRRVVAKL